MPGWLARTHHVVLHRPQRRLRARRQAELAQDVADVGARRALGDRQLRRLSPCWRRRCATSCRTSISRGVNGSARGSSLRAPQALGKDARDLRVEMDLAGAGRADGLRRLRRRRRP